MKPLISVVIPSFNKVKYIGRTLESIIKQDCASLEVIIMDGGSTDGTLGIIQKYADKYPEIIKYESKADKGQWDAINKGLGKAKGKIVTYINADDVYVEGAFSEIERLYRLNIDALWFAGRGSAIDSKGNEIAGLVTLYKNVLLLLNSKFFLLTTNYLMQPSVFITKEAWKRFGPFSGINKYVMEYDLWLKISRYKMPIVTSRSLSCFRIENTTGTSKFFDILLKEDENIVKRYTGNPLILLLHKFNNLLRIATIRAINP